MLVFDAHVQRASRHPSRLWLKLKIVHQRPRGRGGLHGRTAQPFLTLIRKLAIFVSCSPRPAIDVHCVDFVGVDLGAAVGVLGRPVV